MEPTTWVIIGLLLFGGHEHLQKKEARQEVVELKAELQEAQENTQTAIEVNETNATTISALDFSNKQCIATLKEIEAAKIDYERINEASSIRIEELESLVNATDWGNTRIPVELLDGLGPN